MNRFAVDVIFLSLVLTPSQAACLPLDVGDGPVMHAPERAPMPQDGVDQPGRGRGFRRQIRVDVQRRVAEQSFGDLRVSAGNRKALIALVSVLPCCVMTPPVSSGGLQ